MNNYLIQVTSTYVVAAADEVEALAQTTGARSTKRTIIIAPAPPGPAPS